MVNVLTQRSDTSRTGANVNEVTLNTSNVNQTRFGKVFTRDMDGEICARPLCLMGITIPG